MAGPVPCRNRFPPCRWAVIMWERGRRDRLMATVGLIICNLQLNCLHPARCRLKGTHEFALKISTRLSYGVELLDRRRPLDFLVARCGERCCRRRAPNLDDRKSTRSMLSSMHKRLPRCVRTSHLCRCLRKMQHMRTAMGLGRVGRGGTWAEINGWGNGELNEG